MAGSGLFFFQVRSESCQIDRIRPHWFETLNGTVFRYRIDF
jgi:hypothetical protein